MSLVTHTAIELHDLDLAEIRKARDAYNAWQEADASQPEFDTAYKEWEKRKAHLAFMLINKLDAFEARAVKTAVGEA